MNPMLAHVKYYQQKLGAKRRGIGWEFDFVTWCSVWERSGRWADRGTGAGRYVMSRHGDIGPYAADNVAIILATQNTKDAHANGRFLREAQRVSDYSFSEPPTFVNVPLVAECESYRQAVRQCWANRRIQALTLRSLAELIDAYPSHVSDFVHADDKVGRRDLPACLIADFEWVCGNTFVSQWIADASQLTVMEEVAATRAVA